MPREIRSLKEGWSYRPEWRRREIEAYLAEIAAANDRGDALQTILDRERDPVVRQGLRYRMTGQCAATEAFSWAFGCLRENEKLGVLSMVGSMVVAGLPTASIAAELATTPFNIVITERLHLDVRRYLKSRTWLRSMVIEPRGEGHLTSAQAREHRWLTIAFESGAEKLLRVLQGGEDASNETLEVTAQKIEAITGRRALEYVRGLDRDGLAENEDDLKRYLLARSMRSREAATSASEQTTKVKEWGLALVKTLDARNVSDFDAKTLQEAAQLLPVQEMKENMAKELRKKSLDHGAAAPLPEINAVKAQP